MHSDMEYEKYYSFKPEDSRPAKRRRVEPHGLQTSWRLRRYAFEQAWKRQQERIDHVLVRNNEHTLAEVAGFLSIILTHGPTTRLPVGLIVTGPSNGSHSSFFARLSRRTTKLSSKVFISLSSSNSTNLKTLLRTIIKTATSCDEGLDEDEEQTALDRKGPRLLSYELQLLHEYVQEKKATQVILAFQDSETFEGALLSELLELLSCWQDRIPFVGLFCIASTIEAFEAKLTTSAQRSLAGTQFDVAPAEETLQKVFSATVHSDNAVWLGPALSAALLERQIDYIQTIDSFIDGLKYVYMSAFYANALSVFLSDSLFDKDRVPKDHLDALRNVPSFRLHVQHLLDREETALVRDLLNSDQALVRYTMEQIALGQNAMTNMLVATELIQTVQESLGGSNAPTRSNLYIQSMAGKLEGSTLLRTLLLSLRKSTSDETSSLLEAIFRLSIPDELQSGIKQVAVQLDSLIAGQQLTSAPLRSEDDLKNTTMRTTVVAQKVELCKQKSVLSKQDAAYTTILHDLSDVLKQYFKETFIDPKGLVFHEIFIYDLRSPHREVFTPRLRYVIERALAAPHDYLACACCVPQGDDEATLSAKQPTTAILYQLYLESGTLMNVSDLWSAFQAVVSDVESNEEQVIVLFQRALAELRYLGLVKSTRKKADHVAKVLWRGL